jgi:hypothetical protein
MIYPARPPPRTRAAAEALHLSALKVLVTVLPRIIAISPPSRCLSISTREKRYRYRAWKRDMNNACAQPKRNRRTCGLAITSGGEGNVSQGSLASQRLCRLALVRRGRDTVRARACMPLRPHPPIWVHKHAPDYRNLRRWAVAPGVGRIAERKKKIHSATRDAYIK